MRFKKKIVLVTGSSRGIGKATAFAFAKEGALVIVNSNIEIEDGRKVVAEIRNIGGAAEFMKCDVTQEKFVREMFNKIRKKYGKLHVLVNNVGYAKPSTLASLSKHNFIKTIDINLLSVFLCSKYAAPLLKRGGSIINVSSIRGLDICARVDLIDYSAAKAGVISLTIALAKEFAPSHIRVNAVAPAIVNTELIRRLSKRSRQLAVFGTLWKRMAEPEEIAGPILFLASEEASYITGETLLIDAGYRLTEL